jgi:carbamoyltransferase
MYTLGINSAYHDSAACLVEDGVVVAAAEDERFTHVKHAKRPVPFSAWQLPFDAIDFCLREAGICMCDVDHVAYSYDPDAFERYAAAPARAGDDGTRSEWDALFCDYIRHAPRQLIDGAPHHLQRRFEGQTQHPPYRWHYIEHHLAHEASAFLAAPFGDAAVLTMDGRGEHTTTSYGVFDNDRYTRLKQVNLPDSIGLFYEKATSHLGFLHSSDEYKVMALASFGEPRFVDAFREGMRYLGHGDYVARPFNFDALCPPRARGGPLSQAHYDFARSLQAALEETVVAMTRWLREQSRKPRLCMAGGVALNCVMNSRVRDDAAFDDVWVQPAAGDAGTALGAALWIDHRERGGRRRWSMEHAYLGPHYDDEEIESVLRWMKLSHRRMRDVAGETADLLANDKVIGWFQGRMEFGPRALGARSILASPISPSMQARLNEIKDREDFRPVAPVVMEEHAGEWFVNARHAPFMLFVFDVQPDKQALIPAVRHVDGTARVQTISARQNPLYHSLLAAFRSRTGVPVLVNTSFNTRGEPIVCTPRDAIESFWTSPLDALVIGSFVLEKSGDH